MPALDGRMQGAGNRRILAEEVTQVSANSGGSIPSLGSLTSSVA